MSHKSRKRKAARRQARAAVFAALGDETRLGLIAALGSGEPASIAQLTAGSRLPRQAGPKHLRVLARTGIVRNLRVGRESLFAFDPRPLRELHEYLDRISQRWDDALARLKSFVAEEGRAQ